VTPREYTALVTRLGGPSAAARALGVHRVTVHGRMRGADRYPIDTEAELAIRRLVEERISASRQ
jgi:hypothetical protein